ncbi:putative bifunctional diguanylate cyclase/phosphodiesterase [Asanoa iriomotensis]|uniref:GGDEF domain-containing protein n=1 Tax=Asanoa iriomotensis TaxID=234613 RepID=A0ABQ4CAT7_9ACTN|nr:EAL domain-containing protein [Asanoa iriomotensis]GIF59425.1 GGDEF domain-containing protein [Asanoa iriomotensis]
MALSAAEISTSGAQRYAARWTRAIARRAFVPMSSDEVETLLTRHVVRLAEALRADEFSAEPAREVGRALVDANLTDPGTLNWSLRALADHLVDDVVPGLDRPDLAARISESQAALAETFATALRDRTFAQQERISRSAWEARNEAEQALRDSEARFRAVFSGAAIGIGIADLSGHIIDVNQSFTAMLGYTRDEMLAINVADLFYAEDDPGMWQLYKELIEGRRDRVRLEKRYFRKDGSELWTDLAVSLIRHDDGRPRFTVAMVQDITERYALQQRLRFQALHDPLTGLPNRTLFFERLEAVLRDAAPDRRVGVCFLDLDGFKAINDTLGHDVGDKLLIVVARRLAEAVADTGSMVARMGGDEFVILVADVDEDGTAVEVAESALRAVADPVYIGAHQLAVSASVGIVDRLVSEGTATDLMKAADTTLYWAKAEGGRGRWARYDPDRAAREATSTALATALPSALGRDEFVVEYQPIVSFGTGEVRAVEALVRWQHPTLGLLAPDQFIGLAEETGLIVRLGQWVLERACVEAGKWHTEFPQARMTVSVNLSARQVSDPEIVDQVAGALEASGLPPDLLQLELTESAVMATGGEPVRALRKLANTGVRLAIDDFGTGYSNLAYLRQLPIHTLKLAGPFVDGMRSHDPAAVVAERIVDALVRLAHALGLSVTAESVETPEQVERLTALGCDSGQGRHFGTPAAPSAITELLRATG